MEIVINFVFPSIIYLLCAILLIVMIVVFVKAIKTVEKLNAVLDDLNRKSEKLDGVFDIIDTSTQFVSGFAERLTSTLSTKIFGLFDRKKKRKKEEE